MATPIRRFTALYYAINGIGVGHVIRLRAIAREMRKVAPEFDLEVAPFFVTSSEAAALLAFDGFPTFKMPSKLVSGQNEQFRQQLRLAARDCVWSILERMRPDLLLVDTKPSGSFDEFVRFPGIDAMGLCQRKVFIYRPLRLADVTREKFCAALATYDLVLVPEHAGDADVEVPDYVRGSVEWCGPIISCDRSNLLCREAALDSLGVQEKGLHIYVSAGGGGHNDAEAVIVNVCELLGNKCGIQLLIGCGPLYRGTKSRCENAVWLNTSDMARHFAAVDIAISAAGYNSFHELMLAGIPTIFLPLQTAIDDQWTRAARAERVGAAVVVSGTQDPHLMATIERWRDDEQRRRASTAARTLVPKNYATDAARRLIQLFQ